MIQANSVTTAMTVKTMWSELPSADAVAHR